MRRAHALAVVHEAIRAVTQEPALGLADELSLVTGIGLDSLDLLEVAEIIASKSGVTFSDDELTNASIFQTVGTLVDAVRVKGLTGSPG